MGHRKRNFAARPKQLPAASHPDSFAGGAVRGDAPPYSSSPFSIEVELNSNPNRQSTIELSPSVELDSSPFYSTIKLECERALTALRRGNHTKALRLMKESVQRHDNSALIYRVQGTVCVKVASIIDDPNAKQKHLRNAIESARKAVELSPNSIEFANFFANLLYEAAIEPKEYEVVIKECERALTIENPVDPAKESLQEESQQKISSAEARITHVQNELRQLVQKSNIASLSTWMKTFGNGEEKFRLIPIRRVTEDPMEVRSVQARRPNEIKKATKTPEERRKEIEVRVAAARLLQQKSEAPSLQSVEERADKVLDSSSSASIYRGGDRRKYGSTRKNRSSAERKDFVQTYWNTISADMKKELFSVKISDLKAHFVLAKDGLAIEVLSEALLYAETNKTWKFWICYQCGDKFADSESHMHHVVQDHMGNLLPKMQSVLPQNVDNKWLEMLLNCSWKPLDVSAAVKMLSNKTKFKDSDYVEEFFSGNDTSGCEDNFKDVWDDSPKKRNLLGSCNKNEVESTNHEKIVDFDCLECDEDSGPMPYSSLADRWPISNDPERTKLLEQIHSVFEVLLSHKYLAASHLNRVIQFAMDELQGIASGSQLLNHAVEQTPMCICFLGAFQLRKILKFLQELSKDCGLDRYAENGGLMHHVDNGSLGLDIKERIVLNGDASLLLLHESFMLNEYTAVSSHYAVTDAPAAATAIVSNANGVISDSGALLSWIFVGPTSGEQLASWLRTKEEKRKEGMEKLQMLEKDFHHLQSLCEQKCEHLSYEEALQAVEDLCFEEGKKRENATEFVHQSFEHLLRKRQEELLGNENDEMFLTSRIELDVISNVLKEAEALNMSQFGYEETYAGVATQSCDLESGEDNDWRTKDCLHQVDSCIEVAIQRQKEQLYLELSKIDARILRNVTGMQHLEIKLEPVSVHDFRSIVLPLLKSYLRAHLEDLAEKDATEKSDAAREAFLAELALDTKKGVKQGNDTSRPTTDKTKDKKKNKENRKAKDSKVVSVSEQQMLHTESSEQNSLSVASDCDHLDSEIVVSVNGDDLKQQEEFRRRIEIEEEERKLEETLEYQRRIENEAKQKYLSEQHKKSGRPCLEEIKEGLPDVFLEHGPVISGVYEQLTMSMKEQLLQNNGFPSNREGMLLTTVNGYAVPIKSSTLPTAEMTRSKPCEQHLMIQGLTNGGTVEDGFLPSDHLTGKRSRSQKSSKSSDGKHQAVSSGRENIEGGSSHVVRRLKEANIHDNFSFNSIYPISGDNGTMTFGQPLEDDDEERFLADLNKAMQQSLDTFEAHQKLPPLTCLKAPQRPQRTLGEADGIDDRPINFSEVKVSGDDIYGTGLKNDVGEYNCFLNVIIQSLWHIKRFRDEFLQRSISEHVHVGDPCVVCALFEIFTALSIASTDTRREAIAPSSLRIALSNLYPDSSFFQEAQMNDASEVLAVLFDCLHLSYTPKSSVSDSESVECGILGSWDCVNNSCIVHSIFGMDVFELMNCYNCGLESRHLKYTSFFHNINASALRTMKIMYAESSFVELLNLVEMNHQLKCDPEAGGCGKLNYIHHIVSTPPHVFTIVLGWQNTCESAQDIIATLKALDSEIDISVLYRGLDPKNTHSLVSMVCYYGQHYHCFAYSHHHGQWIMYDDKTVKVIASWADVVSMCERGHLQPQVLFFEAVK